VKGKTIFWQRSNTVGAATNVPRLYDKFRTFSPSKTTAP
jgi:hypothetical protein